MSSAKTYSQKELKVLRKIASKNIYPPKHPLFSEILKNSGRSKKALISQVYKLRKKKDNHIDFEEGDNLDAIDDFQKYKANKEIILQLLSTIIKLLP